MTIRRYSNLANPVSLAEGVNAVATTLTVGSTTDYPDVPFLLAIERGTSGEEVCLCTAKTATTFEVTRGYDGTTAVEHDIGALVEHSVAAIDYREAGIVRVTTAIRDAMAGTDLWEGRLIYNSELGYLQRYTGTAWVGATDENESFSIGGVLAPGARNFRWYPPYAITIVSFRLALGVTPSGSAVILDVNRDATTVFTDPGNRPQVAGGANVGTAVTPAVTSVSTSQYLQVEVDQVGSTDPGENAVLTMRYRRV